MGEMMKCIDKPREDYKPFVPRIISFEIAKEFIGAVIGKGGETIQKIQAETGAVVNIDEVDGKVRKLKFSGNLSLRTVLVYEGNLSPSVAADHYFDFLVPAEKFFQT